MSEYFKGKEASKDNPCPICGGTDWCFQFGEHAWACGRTEPGQQPEGWKYRKRAKDSRAMFSLGKEGDRLWKTIHRKWKEPSFDTSNPDWPIEVLHFIRIETEIDRAFAERVKCDPHLKSVTPTQSMSHSSNLDISSKNTESVTCDRNSGDILTDSEVTLLRKRKDRGTPIFPFEVLPEPLRNAILYDSVLCSTDPLNFIQMTLPAISSQMQLSNLDLWGFKSPNIIWAATIQASGGGKSRAYEQVVGPILKTQLQYQKEFDESLHEYNQAVAVWKKSPDESPEPQKPVLNKVLFEGATLEGIEKRLSEQARPCALWARDELAALFKSLGQYKAGNGDDTEKLLSIWNGSGFTNDRKRAEDCFVVGENRVSIAGGIQPEVYAEVFGDRYQNNGMSSRLLICQIDRPLQKWKGGQRQTGKLLERIYDWLGDARFGTVTAPDDLEPMWADWYDSKGREEFTESSEVVSQWMRKAPSHCARLALVLHAIYCYFDRSLDTQVLSQQALIGAFELVEFYEQSLRTMGGLQSEELPKLCESVLSFAKRKGGTISVVDAYRGIKGLRQASKLENKPIAEFTESIFLELKSLGYVSLSETSRGKHKLTVLPSIITENRSQVTQTLQTQATQAYEQCDHSCDSTVTHSKGHTLAEGSQNERAKNNTDTKPYISHGVRGRLEESKRQNSPKIFDARCRMGESTPSQKEEAWGKIPDVTVLDDSDWEDVPT